MQGSRAKLARVYVNCLNESQEHAATYRNVVLAKMMGDRTRTKSCHRTLVFAEATIAHVLLGHYAFRQLTKHDAEDRPGCDLLLLWLREQTLSAGQLVASRLIHLRCMHPHTRPEG